MKSKKSTKKGRKKQSVNLKTICRRLAELVEKGWRVKLEERICIRLAVPGSRKFCFCPLTALAHARKYRRLGIGKWGEAARLLCVEKKLGILVVDAADICFDEMTGRFENEEEHERVDSARRALLQAVGR